MKFNADHYYRIGASHHFCEDFASSGVSEQGDRAYAVVCDGCSSARDSNIGAMLLTKSAEQYLYPILERADEMVNLAMQSANVFARTLGVTTEALRSTLMTVLADKESFRVTTTGDGVVVARHRINGLEIMEIDFSTGAPFYPIYNLTQADRERYLQEFPGMYKIRRHSNGKIEEDLTEVSEMHGACTYAYSYPYEEYDLVGVLSDGVQTFFKEEVTNIGKFRDTVDFNSVLQELFAFKGTGSSFLIRRLQKAFRTFEKNGWKHFDDFSMGVVSVNE